MTRLRTWLLVLTASFAPVANAQDQPGWQGSEEQAAAASFGSDLSLSLAAGSFMGSWAVPAVHSALGLRLDAFTVAVDQPGVRLGLSLFGEKALGLLPRAAEEEEEQLVEFPFSTLQYGVLCSLRPDPALPWGGTAALGFSRLDIEPYYGGPFAAPLLIFEGGARRQLGREPSAAFLDMSLRASWGELRSPFDAMEEIWRVQLVLGIGAHVR